MVFLRVTRRLQNVVVMSCHILWCLTLRRPAYCGVWLFGVLSSAESDFAVSCPLQSLPLQCPVLCRIWLCGASSSAESNSAVSCHLQSLTLRCLVLYGVWLCTVLSSAESDSAVSCPLQSLTVRCPVLYGAWLCGVLSSKEPDSAVSLLDSTAIVYLLVITKKEGDTLLRLLVGKSKNPGENLVRPQRKTKKLK